MGGTCRPKTRDFPANTVLVAGFETDEIELHRGSSAEFGIEAPMSAMYLSCALFIGAPVFRDRALANVSDCVARERFFSLDPDRSEASELSLRLDDLEPLSALGCPVDSALKASGAEFRVVESLHLGCWAMDLDGIIGASRLLELDPSELPEYSAMKLDSCDQSDAPTDRRACWLPAQIGACRQGRCVRAFEDPSPRSPLCLRDTAEGGPCALSSRGVGRCFAGNCLDKSETTPLVTSVCDAEGDWANCFPSPLGLMGTCRSGLCRPRCHDRADCDQGDECTHPPVSYLGVCIGAQESAL